MRVTWRGLLGAVIVLVAATASVGGQTEAVAVEAILTRGIEDRMPVDTATTFAADVGTVWLWTRVTGGAGSTLTHVWRHAGNEWVVSLQIGGSPWRTFSSKAIPPEWTGEWSVEVRDETGDVLRAVDFVVQE